MTARFWADLPPRYEIRSPAARSRLRGDEAFADGEADEVGLALEAEFAEEIRAMRFGGAGADEKFLGDAGIVFSLGGELEDHAFAGGKRLQRIGGVDGFRGEGVDGPF
jgi:hypothetical protein